MKLSLWPQSRNLPTDSFGNLFERFFDRPFTDHLPEVFQKGTTPAANIAEDEKAMTVSLELPGLKEEDIDVQILGNQLVISAERRFDDEKKDKEYHRVEHQYGTFSRTMTLPNNLKTDQVDAVYNKGILTLTIPKVEPTPATKVKVKVEK